MERKQSSTGKTVQKGTKDLLLGKKNFAPLGRGQYNREKMEAYHHAKQESEAIECRTERSRRPKKLG